MNVKTDLAIEAKRLWDASPQRKTLLPGVKARQTAHLGIELDVVEILDEEGARELGKPVGTYVTVNLDLLQQRRRDAFQNTAAALAKVLADMIPEGNCYLVVGLGNMDITPDRVGPCALDHVIVTHHLKEGGNSVFDAFADVSAVAPGVMGKTGLESAQMVEALVERLKPDCLVVVDALASCEPERLCMTVQVTDTGLVPGSGVRNHRAAFTKEGMGVPVIAVGVPTVVDGRTFQRLYQEDGEEIRSDLILSTRDIDLRIPELGKLIGYAINLAAHPWLSQEDIPAFLS